MGEKLANALCWLCIFLSGSGLVYYLALVKGAAPWRYASWS